VVGAGPDVWCLPKIRLSKEGSSADGEGRMSQVNIAAIPVDSTVGITITLSTTRAPEGGRKFAHP